MEIKKVKLLSLLKLIVCEACPHSFKKKHRVGLFCDWDNDYSDDVMDKPTRCINVKSCGSWDEFGCSE